jgi:ribonuclease M5
MELTETEIEAKENGVSPDRRYCYVCEGQHDESKLKSLGCLFVVKTGGKFIRHDILDFLKEVKKYREIVIITDPDGPGRQIENKIVSTIGSCLTIHAKKGEAIHNRKVGIEEMKLEDLKELIRPFIRHDIFADEHLSIDDEDFYDLGLEGAGSKEKRMKLVEKYHIPTTSSKAVEDALLMLGKTRTDVEGDLADE